MPPETSVSTGTSIHSPERRTLEVNATDFRSASTAVSARCSCATSRPIDKITIAAMMPKLTPSPDMPDTAAATRRMATRGQRAYVQSSGGSPRAATPALRCWGRPGAAAQPLPRRRGHHQCCQRPRAGRPWKATRMSGPCSGTRLFPETSASYASIAAASMR